MSSKQSQALSYAVQLLLSPLEDPFRRYLDVCDDVYILDTNGNSLLHWAATVGNVTAAYALLQCGVEVNTRNVYGATPLHLAAAFAPNVGVMGPLLMRFGASLEATISPRNPAGVKSLLASRGLSKLWTWMVELNDMLHEENGRNASLFRCGGSSSLPSVTSIKAMAPLLCAPEDLGEVSKLPSTDMRRTNAVEHAHVVKIPRAPTRNFLSHGGVTNVHVQRQPSVITFRCPEEVEAVAPSTATSAPPIEIRGKETETALALLVGREKTARMQLEKDHAEAILELHMSLGPSLWALYPKSEGDDKDVNMQISGWSGALCNDEMQGLASDCNSSAGLTGHIVAVFGEKCDSEGRRLFVQYKDFSQKAETGGFQLSEAWCSLASVARDPVVIAYLDRYSRTYEISNTVDAEMGSSPMTMDDDRTAGCPLDTMEREQLEEQLRMLPRRNLVSQGSCSSMNTLPKTPSLYVRCAEEPPQHFDQKREYRPTNCSFTDDVTSITSTSSSHSTGDRMPLTDDFQSQLEQAAGQKDNARLSWGFAQGDRFPSTSLQGMWSAAASSAVLQPTLSHSRDRGAHDGITNTPESNSSESGPVQLSQMSDVAVVHRRSSFTLNKDVSTSTSAADSKVTGSPSREGPMGFCLNDGRYFLSATQKEKYNRFLRNSALERLQKLQKRLSSRAADGENTTACKATTRS